MANPRVFISSTYYDLKHVRNDIEQFISSLGYDAVMHDKGGVTYTQKDTLEQSCYQELTTCDIVVCIIGNKFGTESESEKYSITMEELNTAIKSQKKVYICIQKEVSVENRTYEMNKDIEGFKPASVDNIKIHQYVSELKQTVKNHPIIEFDNVNDIIDNLKKQFAGLFQYLMRQEATLTESKTYYDLKKTSEEIKNLIAIFENRNDEFLYKFDGSFFVNNRLIYHLKILLGFNEAAFIISTKTGLIEFMKLVGFELDYLHTGKKYDCSILFRYDDGSIFKTIEISEESFDNNKIKVFPRDGEALKMIQYEEKTKDLSDENDDLPF